MVELGPYKQVINELSISENILRDNRIVIPESSRLRAAQLAHEGHQGMCKTKKLLRERVWFPGVDKMIQQLCGECPTCKLNNGGNIITPMIPTTLPSRPWEYLAIDFHGPLPLGTELMVIVDEQPRFPIVTEVKSTSAINELPKFYR